MHRPFPLGWWCPPLRETGSERGRWATRRSPSFPQIERAVNAARASSTRTEVTPTMNTNASWRRLT
eukprot:11885853-Alexandrium_andersonii.AAC.1